MKRFGPPSTHVVCGLVLLNVFLFAATATGQLAPNPSPVNFGSVVIGNTASQSVVLSNTGNSNLTISQTTVSGTGFGIGNLGLPLTLAPGQSVPLATTFAPQSSGNFSGSVSIAYSVLKNKSHGKGNPPSNGTTTVSLNGTGVTPGQLSANPSSLNFGNIQVSSSQTLTDSITNVGGVSVTISQATVTGPGFSFSGLNPPLTLNPGASVTFSVVFAPLSAGSASGTVTVTSNASNPTLTIPLTGTGTPQGQLAVSPTSQDFGSVTVGASSSKGGSLSASLGNVTVTSANINNSEFSISGISFPVNIAPGQNVPYTVTFAPQSAGTANGVLSFTSNASNAPTETLTGNGVAPTSHSTSLSWTDSNSGISGYNVYRGTVSGGPYAKINSALDPNAVYTDNSVQAGQTYYYVTTAVDSTGAESGYSNEAQAVIPTP
ncbi:MAG: choice-of-anchor D domain-containing protein [Acidobacteriia bacterium]|nr:choice-of-anchor D domain-containing protein [Terriglobia bacterium]